MFNGCQLLETVTMELFVKFGWRFTYRIMFLFNYLFSVVFFFLPFVRFEPKSSWFALFAVYIAETMQIRELVPLFKKKVSMFHYIGFEYGRYYIMKNNFLGKIEDCNSEIIASYRFSIHFYLRIIIKPFVKHFLKNIGENIFLEKLFQGSLPKLLCFPLLLRSEKGQEQ